MKWWQVGGVVTLGVAVAAIMFVLQPQESCRDFNESSVLVDGVTWNVAVADSATEQIRGLMECQRLPNRTGMYFFYARPTAVSFWMKNMRMPLDIIWIREGEVIGMAADVPPAEPEDTSPPTYQPPEPVTAVLEIAAGQAAAHNITVGSRVDFEP